MLLRRVEEELTPIMLNTWESKTISGSLEDKVVVNPLQMGTFAPINYKVCWQGNKTVIYWGIFLVGGNSNHK